MEKLLQVRATALNDIAYLLKRVIASNQVSIEVTIVKRSPYAREYIGDRLESRLSFLSKQNVGFKTLSTLITGLRRVESGDEMLSILQDLDLWRDRRNRALHELVEVEADVPTSSWDERIQGLLTDAVRGYELLRSLYNRVVI